MAFDKSALSEVIKQVNGGFKMVVNGIQEGVTVKLLKDSKNYQAGVITSAPILKMNTDVVLQKQGCGRIANGGVAFGETEVSVTKLASYQDWCFDDLEGTYLTEVTAAAEGVEDRVLSQEYVKQILDTQVAKMKLKGELLLWQGDTTKTTNPDLKWFNGIEKQVAAGTTAISVSGSTSISDKLYDLYDAVDEDILEAEDTYMFMSKAVHRAYARELYKADKTNVDTDLVFAKTDLKIIVVPGLKGSKNVYISRLSNFHMAFTGVPETESIEMWFSKDDNIYKLNAYFSLGIKVIDPSQVVFASIL